MLSALSPLKKKLKYGDMIRSYKLVVTYLYDNILLHFCRRVNAREERRASAVEDERTDVIVISDSDESLLALDSKNDYSTSTALNTHSRDLVNKSPTHHL